MARELTTVAIKAKALRQALKKAFPEIKFSVTSKNYSMGSSIRVSWTDGVTTAQVSEVASQYESVSRCPYSGEILSGGNTYVHADRDYSVAAYQQAVDAVCADYGLVAPSVSVTQSGSPYIDWNDDIQNVGNGIETLSRLVNRLLAETDFTKPQLAAEKQAVEEMEEVEAVVTTEAISEPTEVQEDSDPCGLAAIEPKAVKPYFVEAQYAHLNKNSTIEEYVREVKKGDYSIQLTEVCWEVKLTVKQWNYLLDGNLLTDYDWLDGKGGTNSYYNPKADVETIWQLPEEEMEEWRKCAYSANCVLVTCGYQSIVIDPQGYNYARYVGLDPRPTNLVKLDAA